MDALKILKSARDLGIPESELGEITTLATQFNQSKEQLSNTKKNNNKPKDLLGVDTNKYTTVGDLKSGNEQTTDDLKEEKKEKKKAFLIVNRDKRKEETKKAKKKIKGFKKHLKDLRFTLKNLKEKAKTAMDTAKERLDEIKKSIQSQLQTKKDLKSLGKMMKKIDLNNQKYAPLIAFFNANANRIPSLANPLPELPTQVQELMTEVRVETAERTIVGVSTQVSRAYTASKTVVREVYGNLLEAARNTLGLPEPQKAGGER